MVPVTPDLAGTSEQEVESLRERDDEPGHARAKVVTIRFDDEVQMVRLHREVHDLEVVSVT